MLGSKYPITDVCMTVRDLQRSISFYRDKLGFTQRRGEEGFADFKAEKVTLALWEIGHIAKHVGYDGVDETDQIRKCMVALEVSGREEIDSLYETLSAKGVPFRGPPKEYPWNAYCCYFNDPDGNLWEIYTWIGKGAEGNLEIPDQGKRNKTFGMIKAARRTASGMIGNAKRPRNIIDKLNVFFPHYDRKPEITRKPRDLIEKLMDDEGMTRD